MVELTDLVLPILGAAVAVFVVSALIWTVMPHHKTEWRPIANEDEFLAALRESGVTAGLWFFPKAMQWEEQKQPGAKERLSAGPKGYLTVLPAETQHMGKAMGQSFLKDLVIAVLIAYLASIGLPAGAEYSDVFTFVSVGYLLAYSAAEFSAAIWFGMPWLSLWKRVADALVMGLVAAGIFASLWPGT